MEKGEADPGPARPTAANDNLSADEAARVDAALTRIAEALGRHLARQHIRAMHAANDNTKPERPPREDS